jgi:DNA helicase-4
LIETFHFEWQEKILLPAFKAKLAAAGVSCEPMSPHEIFEKMNQQQELEVGLN